MKATRHGAFLDLLCSFQMIIECIVSRPLDLSIVALNPNTNSTPVPAQEIQRGLRPLMYFVSAASLSTTMLSLYRYITEAVFWIMN